MSSVSSLLQGEDPQLSQPLLIGDASAPFIIFAAQCWTFPSMLTHMLGEPKTGHSSPILFTKVICLCHETNTIPLSYILVFRSDTKHLSCQSSSVQTLSSSFVCQLKAFKIQILFVVVESIVNKKDRDWLSFLLSDILSL